MLSNQSLKPYNTLQIDCSAAFFVAIDSSQSLIKLLNDPASNTINPMMVLGAGSNTLFLHDFPGLILKNEIKGIIKLDENAQHVWLQVSSGENWHDFVTYCVNCGYSGVENLSLIPGTVGAAPIQNIGAYGVEQSQAFVSLEAIDLTNGQVKRFGQYECAFSYRHSVFKRPENHNKYFITSVIYRLSKRPQYSLEYQGLRRMLSEMGVKEPDLPSIRQAVIQLRTQKLPDPEKIANAGSFFKNPLVDSDQLSALQVAYPTVPYHPFENRWKVSAAWLIEQCGWKGHRTDSGAGVYDQHALVLVNHKAANGQAIKGLAEHIQQSVVKRFGILLTPEVIFV